MVTDKSALHYSYIPKSSDIMFASLQAYGLAEFFRRINSSQSALKIYIEDIGAALRVSVNVTSEQMKSQLVDIPLPNILPALIPVDRIVTPEKGKKTRPDSILIRYLPDDFQGETVSYTRERLKAKEDSLTLYISWDDPLFPVWSHICEFNHRSATKRAYPLCVHAWHAHRLNTLTTQGLFDTITQLYDGISDKDTVEKAWTKSVKPQSYQGFEHFSWRKGDSKVTLLSIVSPSAVKGNQTPDARIGINEENLAIFWLELYFAFVGFLCVAIPYEIEDADLLLAFPQIRYLEYTNFSTFMMSFRTNDHYKSLHRKSKQFSLERTALLAELEFFDCFELTKTDEDSCQISIDIAFARYKKIGKVHMPFGTHHFPQERVRGLGLNLKQLILTIESIPIINRSLLSCLHSAIRSNDFSAWLEFFCLYNPRHFPSNLHVKAITEILLQADWGTTMNNKSKNYADIFENPGFIAIAKAINTCTERAAYLKSTGRKTNLRVWHNLDQRLLQHAEEASLFIPDLARFIVDFQKEMSRIRGNNEYKDYIPDVSYEAIKHLLPLINEFGSSVVAYSL